MKLQIIFISIIAILWSKTTTAQNYVDLGLSVLWADQNARGFYTHYDIIFEIKYYSPGETLPAKSEFKELINKCTWEWTQFNNVNGYKITGPNGNHIFLPAAGLYDDYYGTLGVGECGHYWSDSCKDSGSSNANEYESFYHLFFSKEKIYVTTNHESNRYSVRFIKRK